MAKELTIKLLTMDDDFEGIKKIIEDTIKDNPITVYADYRDFDYITNIIADCKTREEFEDKIIEGYDEVVYDEQRALWSLIEERLLKAYPNFDRISDDLDMEIMDYIYNECVVNYPIDDYLNQTIKVNVLVTFEHSEEVYEDEFDKKTLDKFLEKLGYVQTRTIINDMIKGNYTHSDDKFLNSLNDEIANAFRDQYNFLTFIGTITLGQYYLFKADPRKVTFEFNTNTTCGFFDPHNGGGSILNLILPKKLTVRGDAVKKLLVEGVDKYTVEDVYGLVSSCYVPIDLHRGMPKKNKENK